jgi:hypothetical protein
MLAIARNIRTGTRRVVLSSVGTVMLTAIAYAQFQLPTLPPPSVGPLATPPAPATQPAATNPTPQPLGTVLTVPLIDFGTIAAQNVIRGKNVNLLQVSQAAVGDLNTQVATVSIRQHNSQDWTKWDPAPICFLPTWSLSWVKQANKASIFIEQGVAGFGSQQVDQVQVAQTSYAAVLPGTKFVLCPLSAVPAIQALNQKSISIAHISQLALADISSQVALLALDPETATSLQVPGQVATPLVQLNLNLNIIAQAAIGNGSTQVILVDVGQSNNL